jgi:predicted DNA-binding antitoxin AbrB/MazE fold protein
MSVVAIEGVVDHGVVRPERPLALADGTRVYIIVPAEAEVAPTILSPHLGHPEQATDFVLTISRD